MGEGVRDLDFGGFKRLTARAPPHKSWWKILLYLFGACIYQLTIIKWHFVDLKTSYVLVFKNLKVWHYSM
jgi:hypothetical protein